MKRGLSSIVFPLVLQLFFVFTASIAFGSPGATGIWKVLEEPPHCEGMTAPDEFVATAIDSGGNVVAVSAYGIIAKYSGHGSRLWIQRLNGWNISIYACDEGEQLLEWVPTDVVIDDSDNIYVLGLKKHDPTDSWVNRIFLMKLQSNGSTVWTKEIATYDHGAELSGLPPSSRPKMRLWTPDAGGTYLVIGSGLEGNSGFFCYDLLGNLIWHKNDGSPTGPFDLDGQALFKAHLVEYPAGTGQYVIDTAIDVCPVAPGSTGGSLTCNTVETSPPPGVPAPERFSEQGDLICSSHTGKADKVFMLSSTDYDESTEYEQNFALVSIKYNPGTGAYETHKSLFMARGQASIFGDFGTGLALTPYGNLWMTGSWWYDPISIGVKHVYLAEVNPEAHLLSQFDYGHEKLTFAWASSNEVATDRNGVPVIAGYDQDEEGNNKLFLASDTDHLKIYHYVRPLYQFSIFDPVSPATGNYADSAVDLNYPTAGIPLALVRSYASRFSDQSGRLGFGWHLNLLDMYIEGNPTGLDKARLVWGDGHAVEYMTSGKETEAGSTTVHFTPLGLQDSNIVLSGHQDEDGIYFELYNKKLDRTVIFAQATGSHWYPTAMFKGQEKEAPGAFPLNFTYGEREIVVEDVASGRTINFTLDDEGRVTQAEGSAGETVRYQYDANGNLAQVLLPDGSSIQYSYDASHRLTKIEQGEATLLQNTYDEKGRVIQQKDAKNNVTTFAYDEEDRTTTVTSPDGLVTTYAYDRHYRLKSVTDAAGHQKAFTYDELGRLVCLTQPDGSTISYTYDDEGHLTSKTDASGHTTHFTYDAEGHLTSVQRPGGETISFGYTDGLFTSWTNPLGGTYALSYNGLKKLSSLTDPLGGTVSYSYDDQGLIHEKTGRDGKTVTYTRDAAGRVMQKTINDGAKTVTYSFDALGRVISVTGPTGTVAYTYNSRGVKATETGVFGKTISYTYDGTRLHSITAGDFSITTQRDEAGRPLRVTDSFGHTLTYTYDALKRLSSISGPSGVEVSYHYGTSGLLDSITYRRGGMAFRTITITRGPGGRIDAVDDEGAPSLGHSIPSLELSFNQMDEIVGATYDPSGRLLSHGERALTYDLEGRLSSSTKGGHHCLFSYDPVGRRVTIEEDGVEKRFVYAGASPIMELDASNHPTRYFVFGPGMSLVISGSGELQYILLSDFRKNVLAALDAEGGIVSQRLYSPYGLVLSEDGPWPVPFGFLGEAGIYTEATGLVLTRARAYDPETGRFLTPDPKRPTPGLPESFNRYLYAYGDPVNLTDTSGLSPFALAPFWLIPYVNMLPTLRPTNTLDAVALPPMNSFGSDFSLSLSASHVADANPIYSDRVAESGGANPQLAPDSTGSDGLLANFDTIASTAGESEPPPGEPVAAAPGTGYVAGIATPPIVAVI